MTHRLAPYLLLLIGFFLIASLLMSCDRVEPNHPRNGRLVMLAGV